MRFETLEARYITPEMKQTFSLGDVDGLPRNIGPARDMIALKGVTTEGIEAWSAIDTTKFPVYGAESTIESWALLQDLGRNFIGKDFEDAREAVKSLGYLVDHQIFKAGFANLFIDAQATEEGVPLVRLLDGTRDRVEVGVSISKNDSLEQIKRRITDEKFHRIKVKISPEETDYQKIAEIRRNFPEVMLMVDANSSFDLVNPEHKRLLKKYGELGLLMIEQPLDHNDIIKHIDLQREFDQESIPGKICLDESIYTMDDVIQAVEGGIPIINVKVTRVGGLDVAKNIVEYCRKNNVDTWIGGMVELTAPGKAHSLAMAAHEGVTLPSDISGTSAYFRDGQDPCVVPMERDSEGAFISVPMKVGRGWDVDEKKMEAITKEVVTFRLNEPNHSVFL